MFCTKCGRELNPRDRFCAHCGTEVTQGKGEQGKYENVVFNPPFRMEAEKKTAQILQTREDFKGFKELAQENNRRTARSKAKIDWNLEGFPESLQAGQNKSSFDWGSVVERKNSGRSYGFEKLDMSSTMEHKKVDPEEEKRKAAKAKEKEVSLGLPTEDTRVISLEELEKELYDLEEELKADTARTAKYEPFRLDDIDNSEELNAYLDGVSVKKKKPEKEEPKPLKKEPMMKWDLDEDSKAAKGQKAVSSMGLVWGIDPADVSAKKKARKAADRGEVKMIWNLEEKEKEEKARAAAKAKAEAERLEAERLEAERLEAERLEAQRLEAERLEAERKEAERLEAERLEAQRLEEERIEAERKEAERLENEKLEAERLEAQKLEAERLEAERLEAQRLEAERLEAEKAEAKRLEAERLEAERLEAERLEAKRLEEERREAERKATEEAFEEQTNEDIAQEYSDMIKYSDPVYLERTKIFDQNALNKTVEEQEKVEEPVVTEAPKAPEAPKASFIPEPIEIPEYKTNIEEPEFLKPLYQSDFVHPWERKEETPSEISEEPVEVPSEETPEEPAEEITEEALVEETPEEDILPAEEVLEETASEEDSLEELPEENMEEAPVEEPAEEMAEEPTVELPEEPQEEPVEEPTVELPEEPAQEPVRSEDILTDRPLPEGERPAFYTFSQKNEAFQELLLKERKRLEDMGADYAPQNETSKVKVSLINDKTPETLAYEENGHFVEGVVQPIRTIYADLSGDPRPNPGQFKYSKYTDTDWLREMTSASDLSSINKTKLRYSDLFPTPAVDDKFDGTGTFREKTDEEKKEIAADINKIFDEDENTKPKSHVVGNIIMILLILVILFEGSVLGAKIIAPDSKYAHVSDGIIEKVLNLFSKDEAPAPSSDADLNADVSEKDSDAAYYQGVVSTLSQGVTEIAEIIYQDELSYSDIDEPAFDGVANALPFVDEDWYEDENGNKVTYAEGIYAAIINYYIGWPNINTNENLIGVNKLELGEINKDSEGYYSLIRVTYATADGSQEIQTKTCFLTEQNNKMFIEEIKEETING